MSKNKYNHNNESWEAEPLFMTDSEDSIEQKVYNSFYIKSKTIHNSILSEMGIIVSNEISSNFP